MNSKFYKYCVVPQCESTTTKTPEKLFIYVPNKKQIRNVWLELARRDPESLSKDSRMYFCEDHFDLSKDMENYMEYHIMGSVSQIRLKPGCIPSKFDCQPDRKKQTSRSLEKAYITKIKNCSCQQPNILEKQNQDLNGSVESSSNSLGEDIFGRNSDAGMRCPMIQIPLSTNQFAPPVDSDTDSDAEYGVEIFSQESVVPSELLNEVPVELEDTTTEIAEDVPENMSMYCDEEDAPSHKQDPRPKGEVTLFGGFRCSVCDVSITGFRYTCVQCSDFDLCGACETNREHRQHYMLRVPTVNSYPDVMSVLDTIRRHLMKDLDPIAELDPDPGERVKCEIKSECEDDGVDTEITVENDGFDNVDTSELFEDEHQEGNIPSVRPVAVIRVNEAQHSSLPGAGGSESTSEFTGQPHVKRKIHITMSELPHVTQGKRRRVMSASNKYNGGNASSVKLESGNKIEICIPPPDTIVGQVSDQTQLPSDDRSSSAAEDKR